MITLSGFKTFKNFFFYFLFFSFFIGQLYVTQFRIIIVAHNQSAICAIPLTGVDVFLIFKIIFLRLIFLVVRGKRYCWTSN